AYSSLTETEISVELAEEALKEILTAANTKVVTVDHIIDVVSRYFDLRPEEFRSQKRSRNIAYPRQIAMYLCRELIGLSLPKIGSEFGGRDHTTVIHAIEKIEKDIAENSETKRAI